MPVANHLGLVVTTPALPAWNQLWAHVFMVHTLSASTAFTIDGPMWSLGVEAQFYLTFPLAVWLVHRYKVRGIAMIAVASIAYRIAVYFDAHSQVADKYVGGGNASLDVKTNIFLGHWMEFGIGMLAAMLVRRQGTRSLGWRYELAGLAGCLTLYLAEQSYMTGPSDRGLLPVGDVLLGTAYAALIVLACAQGSWIGRVLGHARFVWLGTISYSLYLIHQPILLALGPSFIALHLSGLETVLLLGLFGVPLAVACAALFWFVFERPFLNTARLTRNTSVALVVSGEAARVGAE